MGWKPGKTSKKYNNQTFISLTKSGIQLTSNIMLYWTNTWDRSMDSRTKNKLHIIKNILQRNRKKSKTCRMETAERRTDKGILDRKIKQKRKKKVIHFINFQIKKYRKRRKKKLSYVAVVCILQETLAKKWPLKRTNGFSQKKIKSLIFFID